MFSAVKGWASDVAKAMAPSSAPPVPGPPSAAPAVDVSEKEDPYPNRMGMEEYNRRLKEAIEEAQKKEPPVPWGPYAAPDNIRLPSEYDMAWIRPR